MSEAKSAYREAGVDIDAQERGLDRIKKIVASTRRPEVLSDIGAFGGLFRFAAADYQDPVLVASADGVGTKLAVARLAGDYSTVGRDLVNHCVNDLLVQGAEPLFFLDYVGAGTLDPERLAELVEGVGVGCRENGCALLGGETAEMPGFYQPGDYELIGFIVGVVDRAQLLDGSRVAADDVLIGLPSAGLHTNGFSLARRIFLELRGLDLDDRVGAGARALGDILLAPHLSYLEQVRPLLRNRGLHAMAHITGGGLIDNLPRMLPADHCAEIHAGTWEVPEEMRLLQEWGGIETYEMLRVFNMGLGMVLFVAPESVPEMLELLQAGDGPDPRVVGSVRGGGKGVVYLPEDREQGGEPCP